MQSVRCPKCGLVQMVQGSNCKGCGGPLTAPPPLTRRAAPAPAPTLATRAPDGAIDPAFDRDRFLLRQKVMTIHEKYVVWDEQGQPVLYVERPGHHLRQVGALLAGFAAGALVAAPLILLAVRLDTLVLAVLGAFAGLAALLVVATSLGPKRHVYFYRDESRAEPLLEVLQDKKFAGLTPTYTLQDPHGSVLARFSKNVLTDVFRKKWLVHAADGRRLCVAREDSLLRALIRRFLTSLVVMNFEILRGESEEVIGSFNRKFTLLDRYVLDLTRDPGRLLDRRVAVALGVLLDTGERR